MPRVSAVHEYALKVLGDTWHPYEWALYEVSKGVPPNLAVRRAEEDRRRNYIKMHPGVPMNAVPPRTRNNNIEYLVKIGSRSIARTVLLNEAFEHVKHNQTGQRLVRVLPLKAMTPPPNGYVHFRVSGSKFEGWTKDEIAKFRSEQTRKGLETRLRKQGIDPATHKSKAQIRREFKEWWATASDEEKREWHHKKSLKAAETRRKAKEAGQDGTP